MKRKVAIRLLTFIVLLVPFGSVKAQEVLLPLTSSVPAKAVKSADTSHLTLPFFDDFSNYTGLPDAARWRSNQALVNTDFAPKPPTLGMVTLDALDGSGNLYAHASTNLFGADTLASRPIRLDSLLGTTRRALTLADSIVLSFFYLPGGWYGNMWERVGDAPNVGDSLFLEFYAPADSAWQVVWAADGRDADTAGLAAHWPWLFVAVKVEDTRFLSSDFQFRFRNYASLEVNPKAGMVANCDQWNIDYIYLNYNRTQSDSTFRDIAFVEKAPSMLAYYRAMPARQYRTTDMATAVPMGIVNRYAQTLASNYSYVVYDEGGTAIASYSGGYENVPPFFPNGTYQSIATHANPPIDFAYPVSDDPTTYRVVHVVREGVGGDNHVSNDTTVFMQHFGNYYAYDDGFAENGYGLTTTGSRCWLACRFDLNAEDTLTAVDLFFNRTRGGENESIRFHLCLWAAQGNKPGSLIYKEEQFVTPLFSESDGFVRYRLAEPQVVDGMVFVGLEQLGNNFINLGFDRSYNSSNRICYRTGNEWQTSILSGSLMLRPVFGTAALVSIPVEPISPTISLSPNPAASRVSLLCKNVDTRSLRLELFDRAGRRLLCIPFVESLDVEAYPAGVYFLRLTDTATGMAVNKKLVISR